jgi:hypothetical protein
VCVRESVNLHVPEHAALKVGTHAAQLFAPDDVGEQVPQAKFYIRFGKEDMSQPVHE